ncbi:MAG: hypothetical protein IPO95_08775 [Rhodanobacteraceae bacterium]|nr:hypothetical protein [Rhodanobacteraceae bacterium]
MLTATDGCSVPLKVWRIGLDPRASFAMNCSLNLLTATHLSATRIATGAGALPLLDPLTRASPAGSNWRALSTVTPTVFADAHAGASLVAGLAGVLIGCGKFSTPDFLSPPPAAIRTFA